MGRLALLSDNKTKVRLAHDARAEAVTALALEPSNDLAHHLMGRWHSEMANLNVVVRTLVRVMYGTALAPGETHILGLTAALLVQLCEGFAYIFSLYQCSKRHALKYCREVWSLRTAHFCHAALCHTSTHILHVCCSCTWISYVGAVAVGSHHDALESYQTAVSLAPARLIHRVELGRTLDRLGKKEQARRELEVSLPCQMHCTSIRCVQKPVLKCINGIHQHLPLFRPDALPSAQMPFCKNRAT